MYFDRRLWELTRGMRGRILLAILLGLLAAGFGIARFALLGALLARVFSGAGLAAIALAASGVGLAVLLRGFLDHTRTVIAHRTASRVQDASREQGTRSRVRPERFPHLLREKRAPCHARTELPLEVAGVQGE